MIEKCFYIKNYSETGSLSLSNRQSWITSVYKKQACTSNFCVTGTVYCIIHRIIQHHTQDSSFSRFKSIGVCCYDSLNPLNAELNTICYLLALLAHNFLHVSRIRVKSLTLRLLTSYIYGAPILDVSRSHRGHGYLSVVSVVCCQVEVSATSWSLVQRSPTECGASLCVI